MAHEDGNVSGPTVGTSPLVLVVEDEHSVRRMLMTGLKATGYRVEEAESGADAVRMVDQYLPDMVLLDLGLVDMDGVEVARQIRARHTVPIIVVSARTQESQKVAALDAGADDYVTKPFGFAELLARMRVALRHVALAVTKGESTVFDNGALRVDFTARQVFVKGAEVHLTPVEFRLIATLIENAGKVVTHQKLLTAVWGLRSTENEHYLRIYMGHLRRKIEPDMNHQSIFQTEVGVGYRLREPSE